MKRIELFNNKVIALNKENWLNFLSVLKENCFWIIDTDIKSDDSYLDGSQWILEGVNGENNCTNLDYHMAVRNSPDSSRFLNICKEIFKLEPLNARNIYEW